MPQGRRCSAPSKPSPLLDRLEFPYHPRGTALLPTFSSFPSRASLSFLACQAKTTWPLRFWISEAGADRQRRLNKVIGALQTRTQIRRPYLFANSCDRRTDSLPAVRSCWSIFGQRVPCLNG